MEQNTHNEGNQMVKGISMIGLVALARYIFYFLPQLHYYWWGVLVTVVFIIINLAGVIMTSRTLSKAAI